MKVKLGERPSQEELMSGNLNPNKKFDLLGFEVEKHNSGVIVVDVKQTSNEKKKNILKGDIITSIGTQDISSTREYNQIISKYKSGDIIMLRIIRNGNPRYIAYEIY